MSPFTSYLENSVYVLWDQKKQRRFYLAGLCKSHLIHSSDSGHVVPPNPVWGVDWNDCHAGCSLVCECYSPLALSGLSSDPESYF